MEQSTPPSRQMTPATGQGWLPIGDFFNAVAAAKLVQMGWEQTAAEREVASRRASLETLRPIIEKMRSCKLYNEETSPNKKSKTPSWAEIVKAIGPEHVELIAPFRNEEVREHLPLSRGARESKPKTKPLDEIQKAMGAAHFEVMELIRNREAQARMTISRTGQLAGGTNVEYRAFSPLLTATEPTRRRDGEGIGLIPNYSENRAGDHILADAAITLSDIEVFVPRATWERRYPAEASTPQTASITIRYADIPIIDLCFGQQRAAIDLDLNVAALVCVILRGPAQWTRWDELYKMASQIECRPKELDYILSSNSPQEKNDEYRIRKERAQRGLVAELGHFAAEWPWLYGHLGSLNKIRPGVLEVDPRGQGIRYNAPVAWAYAATAE